MSDFERFRTHTGEIVTGERLATALNRIAASYAESANIIRTEDKYAAHVTAETKDRLLRQGLEYAAQIKAGTAPMSFALWQSIDTELTGECVGLLAKRG